MQDLTATTTSSLDASHEGEGSQLWSPWSTQTSPGSEPWHGQTAACHSQMTAYQNVTDTTFVDLVGFRTRPVVFQHVAEARWALRVPHWLLAGLCSGRLVGDDHFDDLSCISAYLRVSCQGCTLTVDTAFLEQRHPSCVPSHCSVLCFVRKIGRDGQLPHILPSCHKHSHL